MDGYKKIVFVRYKKVFYRYYKKQMGVLGDYKIRLFRHYKKVFYRYSVGGWMCRKTWVFRHLFIYPTAYRHFERLETKIVFRHLFISIIKFSLKFSRRYFKIFYCVEKNKLDLNIKNSSNNNTIKTLYKCYAKPSKFRFYTFR